MALDILNPHFYKTLDLIGSNFLSRAEQSTENLVKYHPPPSPWSASHFNIFTQQKLHK